MPNPAFNLLQIFNVWAGGALSAGADRKMEDGSLGDVQHLAAMKHLSAIDVELTALEAQRANVSMYRNAISAWTRYIVAYPHGWSSNHSSTLTNAARIDMLEALADRLDGRDPLIDFHGSDILTKLLDEIVDLLEEDGSLSRELRYFILKLVQEVRVAFEDYKVTGHFEGKERLTNLWVALGAAESESKSDPTKWQKFRDTLLVPSAVGIIVGAPGTAMQAIGMMAAS